MTHKAFLYQLFNNRIEFSFSLMVKYEHFLMTINCNNFKTDLSKHALNNEDITCRLSEHIMNM